MKTALIAGASGLVGRHLLDELLAAQEYGRVVSLGRRRLPLEHPKLRQEVVDFAALEPAGLDLQCDDAYCCLGHDDPAGGFARKNSGPLTMRPCWRSPGRRGVTGRAVLRGFPPSGPTPARGSSTAG